MAQSLYSSLRHPTRNPGNRHLFSLIHHHPHTKHNLPTIVTFLPVREGGGSRKAGRQAQLAFLLPHSFNHCLFNPKL